MRLHVVPVMKVAGGGGTYRDAGAGAVTVFVVPGSGRSGAEWWPIQDVVGARTRVLAWDRPGCGDSGPPRSPRTVGNIAREAIDVLAAAAPDGPLVLVGHGTGARYAEAIARLLPARVRGMVLLDPVDGGAGLRGGRTLARLRLAWLLKPLLMRRPPLSLCRAHPADAVAGIWRHLTRVETYDTALAELAAGALPAELERLGPLPEVPVVVPDPAPGAGSLHLLHPEVVVGAIERLLEL